MTAAPVGSPIVGMPICVAEVGKGSGVTEGSGVWVGISVGGRRVGVGMDCCVSATIVNAAACAVF